MKKIMMLLLAAVLLAACNSTTKKTEAAAAEEPAAVTEWVEVTLDVEGMTCDGCENAIKAGVESLDGIASVESSHEEGWTKVKFDKAVTSVEAIEVKITDTGYEVKGEL
ncbi:MAG: cation transporter [Bacteroidota bacterium]|nr:cation transporter [Bacteroidota bacterium]